MNLLYRSEQVDASSRRVMSLRPFLYDVTDPWILLHGAITDIYDVTDSWVLLHGAITDISFNGVYLQYRTELCYFRFLLSVVVCE